MNDFVMQAKSDSRRTGGGKDEIWEQRNRFGTKGNYKNLQIIIGQESPFREITQ